MDCLIGIHEKRILTNINSRIDSLILNKIVGEYLYPKKPYLEELLVVSKYFKVTYLYDCSTYYKFNKQTIIEQLNQTSLPNTINYYERFKHMYMDYKDCVIDIKKTFNYNKFIDIDSLKNNFETNWYQNDIFYLNFVIDSALMIRSYRKLLVDMYDFYTIQRSNFISQKDYILVLDSLNETIDEYLYSNNICSYDLYDLTYCEKLEIFRTL